VRALNYVDVIVRTFHSKERVSNLKILCNNLKYDYALTTMSLYCPCQANGHFFHSHFMQSMLSNIPGNPLDLSVNNRWVVSPTFGSLGYSLANTYTTALQNLYIDESRHVDSCACEINEITDK
jgi:hypothetical protein